MTEQAELKLWKRLIEMCVKIKEPFSIVWPKEKRSK